MLLQIVRRVGVLLLQLRGVPWVGAHEGLSVEVRALGAAKSQWLFLPNAKGPEVIIQVSLCLVKYRHVCDIHFLTVTYIC